MPARADRWAVAVLTAFPILLYVPFSLAGHPLLPGDNLTQNYPLRLLAGEMLRAGRLPAWNPFIWSGTPLLAGWNGGSMFPATWLFALLPGIAAWTVGYVANAVVASLGAYVLLRRLRCASLPAALGAAAFTYTGFMEGQIVHIGLVQGTALMPWTLVALEALGRRSREGQPLHRLAGPAALLAAASGLTVLAGDPRAVTTTATVDLVFAVALLLRPGRLRFAAGTLVGVGLGGLLAAVQWIPGLGFIHGSQRGDTAYAFYGAGSLSLPHLASFVLAPFLYGGNGNFGLPNYAGTYNLPELTIGVGVLATVAFMAFLPDVARSAATWVATTTGRRPRTTAGAPGGIPEGRRLGVWYVLAGVGVLLALGSNTPLGHLLVHVPFFGAERLQNRNAAILDLALVVLLAFLLDDLLERPAESPLRRVSGRVLGLAPLLAIVGLFALSYADPSVMRSFMQVSPSNTGLFTSMAPDVAWELVLVAGAAVLVARPWIVQARWGRAGLVALALLDVAFFVANATYAGSPSSVVGGPGPLSRTVGRLAGAEGRFALYNPLTLGVGVTGVPLVDVGAPDVNMVQGNASVQGYGSIVGSAYQQATSTHAYENLAVGGLAGTTFDVLDLRTLLTLPAYFETPLAAGEPPPAPGTPVPGASATPAAGTAAAVVGGPYRIAAGSRRVFLLDRPVAVHEVALGLSPGPAAQLRVSLATTGAAKAPSGSRTVSVHGRGALRAVFPGGPGGDEVVVANAGRQPVVLRSVVASVGAPSVRLALDGPLQGVLTPPHWRYQAVVGPLVAWENTRAGGLAWLEPPGSSAAAPPAGSPGTRQAGAAAGDALQVSAPSPTAPETVRVRLARPALLVRSETYATGWTARLTPLGGGASRVVPVERLGLVQAVPVPAGRYEITWHYAPRSVRRGLLASAAGLAGLVALVLLGRRRRPGQRGGKSPLGAGTCDDAAPRAQEA